MEFLDGVRIQLERGQAPVTTFTAVANSSPDIGMKRAANSAISSINMGKAFADGWAQQGIFPRFDAALLSAGERYNITSEIITLLSDTTKDPKDSFLLSVIVPNLQMFAYAIASIIFAIGVLLFADQVTVRPDVGKGLFFVLLQGLIDAWPIILLILVSVVFAYFFFRIHANMNAREVLYTMGTYASYDAYQIVWITGVLVPLMRSGNCPPREAIDLLIELSTVRSGLYSYHTRALIRIRATIDRGGSFIEAFGRELLTSTRRSLIAMQASAETAPELEQAFLAARESSIKTGQTAHTIIRNVLGFLLMVTMVIFFTPPAMVIMGA